MYRSGFDQIVKELLMKDSVVYGGENAGAIVAGPSISGVESADEPEFAESIIREGLGIATSVILPHVDNVRFSDALPSFRDAQH